MKNSTKRIIAYGIDIIIVVFISSLLTMFIPVTEKYKDAANSYINTVTDYANKKIDDKEYRTNTSYNIYLMNKENVPVSIVLIVISIMYFVVYNYFSNGKTLGKKIMHLQIISNNKKKLTMNNYLIRSLIINSICLNIVNNIGLMTLNYNEYSIVNKIFTIIYASVFITSFVMISYRQDMRGLHDFISNTKVISTKKKEKENLVKDLEKNEDTKLKDAEIIDEKKVKM